MKHGFRIGVAALALIVTATPVAIAASPAATMMLANPPMGGADGPPGEADIMAMFSKLFDTGDKTPIDPAQLELGRKTSAALLPDGAYGKIMDQMMGTFLKPILALDPGMSASDVAQKTGIDFEAAMALTDEQRSAVQALLDPNRKQRTEGTMDLIRPMIIEMGKALEAPMREGIAKAYARKFSAEQLGAVNAFFTTPTGAAYAAESFAIQADPEVMSATFQALPVMMTKFMGNAAEMEGKMKALPQERALGDLSAADLGALAKLLGTTTAALQEYGAAIASEQSAASAAGAAVDAVDAAADAASAASDDSEGSEAWYDRANWSPEDVAAVEALEAKADAAIGAQIDAQDAAAERARARLSKKK